MEKRKNYYNYAIILGLVNFIAVNIIVDVEAGNSDLSSIPQQANAQPEHQRRELSPSEQAQILSDVRQHEPKFVRVNQPQQLPLENTSPYPNLAKYKVDRVKQQQELLQQQALLLRQQKANQQQQQQLNRNFFETAQTQYKPQIIKQQQQQQLQQQQQQQQQLQAARQNRQEQYNQFQGFPGGNNYQNLNPQLFNDDQNIQLQSYFEKQRLLEVLQRQRERLLAEQQELRRQQEVLRLQQLHHLTTTTTTPAPPPHQTTYSSLLLSSPSARKITPAESDLFLKAIANHQKKFSIATTSSPAVTTTTTTTTTPRPTTLRNKQEIPKDILSLIEAQESQSSPSLSNNGRSKPQIQIIYQTEKPAVSTNRQKSSAKTKSSQTSAQRDALLKQLKLALLQAPIDDVAKNHSTRDIVLANGKTVQLIHAPNSLPSVGSPLTSESLQEIVQESLPTTSIRPPNAILEELTKGVLPPGADFEVLRHKLDGNLESVGKAPLENTPAKKVTFVVLEEQPDGSYKVQGVKGNTDKESGGDVESIVERIKNGELKLPPPSNKPSPTSSSFSQTINHTEYSSPSTKTFSSTAATINAVSSSTRTPAATTFRPRNSPETARNIDFGKSSNDYFPFVTISSAGESATDKYVTSATTPTSHSFNSFGTTLRSPVRQTQSYASVSTKYPSSTRSQFIPTMAPVNEIVTQYQTTTSSPATAYQDYSTTGLLSPTTYAHFGSRTSPSPTPRSIQSNTPKANTIYEENYERSTTFAPSSLVTVSPSDSHTPADNLIQIFKRQGLYAMAKFLGQSGLDTILNDTGPYTLFAPTDKAFRTLLVQLGGPEKAEQKFRESPRLLSGLLLHHVIPGAFRIDSLQDEMTGVSLAGTQLRVNVYSMQDVEWNDVRVTTINGARVLPDKQNIEIPQGVAHAVDRVMFPLPVGDLVQTLQADRERRFTVFLRALHSSGLEETLSGSKTYTIFAPTDTAFMIASASPNGSPPWLDDEDNQEAAKALVSRHVIPSTLYSAGMRYYQQKETLQPQASLHIHKSSGRIKVNNAQVITHNIPATNGVIHAVDSLL